MHFFQKAVSKFKVKYDIVYGHIVVGELFITYKFVFLKLGILVNVAISIF